MNLSQRYVSNIYFVRSMCLGADLKRGDNQKPFNGKIDYDFIMWIDSDIIFTPTHFEKLLSNNLDICGGLYLMDGGNQFTAVEKMDESYFKENGSFQFMTPDDIKDSPRVKEVSYTGFGFLLIKKGVFETIKYPWFEPKTLKIGNYKDFVSEDVSFCLKAKEAGFKIHIDPTVWVRHQKLTLF